MSASLEEVLATMRQRFVSMNAVPVTRAHITSDEFSAMEAEIAKLRNDLHLERMRLVACGVIALSDTPESAAKARDMLPEYRSASCDDVARRVDECMKLRADLEKARAEIAFLDGDLLYWVGRAVSKGNANSDTEEAWERYEQWLRDR